MDLIRLLRSLEEFLYELAGWLVFYPRTFWRVLVRPGGMALYTRTQLELPAASQFVDTISPVLMLLLSVVLIHLIELAAGLPAPTLSSGLRQLLFGTEQALLLTRSVFFCMLALAASVTTLAFQGKPLNRETLRAPFSIQSYLVAVFAVLLSTGFLLARIGTESWHQAGYGTALLAVIWYLWARVRAYRAVSGAGTASAVALVVVNFTLTAAALLALMMWM
jgi:hypothetical protein